MFVLEIEGGRIKFDIIIAIFEFEDERLELKCTA